MDILTSSAYLAEARITMQVGRLICKFLIFSDKMRLGIDFEA